MENKNISADFATITHINGDAVVRRLDGSSSPLGDGDRLSAGDVVITSPNASLEIAVTGGSVLQLSKSDGGILTLDSAVFDKVGHVDDSSVSLDALNVLLAHYSNTITSPSANAALNLSDVIVDADQDVFGSAKHASELVALPTVDGGDVQSSLAVTHWNHIDT